MGVVRLPQLVFNQDQSINSGFAVDVWRPTHFATGTDAFTHLPVGNIFTGINVDVAVRDTDAWIFRVGYNVTLLGKVVFLTIPKTLFSSNFDPTPDGDPPSTVQAVGTARVEGRPRSVIVIDPPFVHTNKWVRISRPTGPEAASVVGVLTEVHGDGVYSFSAAMFMPAGSGVASISFETTVQEFLHLDFMPDNKVRIDDIDTTEFGSFPRDQVFLVQVTLNISAAQSTAHACCRTPAPQATGPIPCLRRLKSSRGSSVRSECGKGFRTRAALTRPILLLRARFSIEDAESAVGSDGVIAVRL
jgi:hypothetical protein